MKYSCSISRGGRQAILGRWKTLGFQEVLVPQHEIKNEVLLSCFQEVQVPVVGEYIVVGESWLSKIECVSNGMILST